MPEKVSSECHSKSMSCESFGKALAKNSSHLFCDSLHECHLLTRSVTVVSDINKRRG